VQSRKTQKKIGKQISGRKTKFGRKNKFRPEKRNSGRKTKFRPEKQIPAGKRNSGRKNKFRPENEIPAGKSRKTHRKKVWSERGSCHVIACLERERELSHCVSRERERERERAVMSLRVSCGGSLMRSRSHVLHIIEATTSTPTTCVFMDMWAQDTHPNDAHSGHALSNFEVMHPITPALRCLCTTATTLICVSYLNVVVWCLSSLAAVANAQNVIAKKRELLGKS
jgi:hypothetical protein